MIAAALSLLIAFAIGLPAARLADPDAPLARLAGEAFLLGIAICALSLFVLSLAGVSWTRLTVAPVLLAIGATLYARARRTGWQVARERLHLVDLLTLATLAGYALYATIAPPAEIDFIADWGLKARVFALHGGIDWRFLTTGWYLWSHPDYPPLLPLTFDWMSLAGGRWNPASLGLLYPAASFALLLIIRSWLADEFDHAWMPAAATLAIAPLAISPWVGIADGPLVAFATAGVLLLRRALQRNDVRLVTPAALLIGCAAMTKNEGLAMVAAAALAIGASAEGIRAAVPFLARLWPAAALAAPWLIVRAILGLSTDLARGSVLTRVLARLDEPMPLLRALATWTTGAPLLWSGLALAILLNVRALSSERLALSWTAAQLAFYIAAYFVTVNDVSWQVRWSWERLVSHVTPTLAFAAIVLLAHNLPRRKLLRDA